MDSGATLALARILDTGMPTGAFTTSGGWEVAARRGWLRDATDAALWLRGLVEDDLGGIELPHLRRAHAVRSPWPVDRHLDRYALVARWRDESRRSGGRLLELEGHPARPCHRAVAAGWLLGRAGVPAPAATAAYAQSVCLGQSQAGVRLGIITADEAVALVRGLGTAIERAAARAQDGRVRAPRSARLSLCGLLHPALPAPLFSS